jgi:soluble lytic murein transglycosylase
VSSRIREVVLVALALSACQPKDGPAHATNGPADGGPPDASTFSITIGGDAGGEDGGSAELATALPWQEYVRLSRWKDAEDAIARLPAGEQNKAEVRFARARVLSALGKHADAVKLLEKMEEELPLLREHIAKTRAQSALSAGPFERAAEYYASRPLPSSWLLAAEAWEKAGDQVKARVQCDRVIAENKRTRSQEEKARAMRMRLVALKEGDAAAAADARWLATHALDEKSANEAQALLDKQSPPKPLTSEELLTRSKLLADAMKTDAALNAVERAANARGTATEEDKCRTRAEAFYKARTRYPEAAVTYQKCAQLNSPRAAEYSFLAARAFSRADRDGDALPAFEKVIQRHARTPWADQAEFHIARTHFLAGRWRDAATTFDEYAKHWPAGKEKREADRYRALSHLLAGDHKQARKLLEDLSGGSEDQIQAARWTNLAALAALRDGDKTHAIARWTDVAKTKPLSWPALVARARLAQAAAAPPVPIEPAESGTPPEAITIDLPPPSDVLHRVGFDTDAEEAIREREGALVAKAGGRGTEALCAAYAAVDRGKRRHHLSLQIPGPLLSTAPGPRNRWAWECTYPRPHKGHVRTHEAATKLPPDLVWSVMRQESAFDPEVVSPARAVGLMQLLPETARAVAKDAKLDHDESMLTVPEHNIALGARYLRELLDKLDDVVPLAVAAYNAGPEAIQRWLSKSKGETLDVFVEAIPFIETRGYVVRVMGNLARYGYLERGDAGVPVVNLELKTKTD